MVELQKQSKTLQQKVGSLKDEKAAVEELQEQLDNKYVSLTDTFYTSRSLPRYLQS